MLLKQMWRWLRVRRRVQRNGRRQLKKWMKMWKPIGLQLASLLVVHTDCSLQDSKSSKPSLHICLAQYNEQKKKRQVRCNTTDLLPSKALPERCWWSGRKSQGREFCSTIWSSCLLNTNLMSFKKLLWLFGIWLLFTDVWLSMIATSYYNSKTVFIKSVLHCSFICEKTTATRHLESRSHFYKN